jgi:hypothetical protein
MADYLSQVALLALAIGLPFELSRQSANPARRMFNTLCRALLFWCLPCVILALFCVGVISVLQHMQLIPELMGEL